MNELAKEVQNIKPGKEEQEIDYIKQTQVESKTASHTKSVNRFTRSSRDGSYVYTSSSI